MFINNYLSTRVYPKLEAKCNNNNIKAGALRIKINRFELVNFTHSEYFKLN